MVCVMRSLLLSLRFVRLTFVASLFILILMVVAACVGPTFIVQQYAGSPRTPETIAILRVNGSDSVRLLILDDEDVAAPIESDGRLHIEMLPARHLVIVGNAKAPQERFVPISWQAEAGKIYRVAFVNAGDGGLAPHIYEVDRSRDTILRDVTASPTTDGPIERRPQRLLPPPEIDPSSSPSSDSSPDAG
jgi:hypothetical protein